MPELVGSDTVSKTDIRRFDSCQVCFEIPTSTQEAE